MFSKLIKIRLNKVLSFEITISINGPYLNVFNIFRPIKSSINILRLIIPTYTRVTLNFHKSYILSTTLIASNKRFLLKQKCIF